jgi:hypothetical protein
VALNRDPACLSSIESLTSTGIDDYADVMCRVRGT